MNGMLDLSMCRSYPQSDFSIILSNDLSHKNVCPTQQNFADCFQKILIARFWPDYVASKVVILVSELSRNTLHGSNLSNYLRIYFTTLV